MTIIDTRRARLAQLIAERYASQADFVTQTGESQSEVSGLLKTKSFGEKKARKIEAKCGLPPMWLDGETELSDPTALPVLQTMKIVTADDSNVVQIPLVKLTLSAGITGFQIDQDTREHGSFMLDPRWIAENRFSPERLLAIKVKGESMEPSLYPGDTVVINTADIRPVDGSVYAVNYEGEPVVKRLSRDAGEWWLTSDNADQRKYHRKICRGTDCIIIGKIVKKDSNHI